MILDEIRGRTSLYLCHRELNRTSKRVYGKRLFGVARYIVGDETVKDGNKILLDHYVTSAMADRLALVQCRLEKKLATSPSTGSTHTYNKLVKLMHDRLVITERRIQFMEKVARQLRGYQKKEYEDALVLRTKLRHDIALLEH